MKKSLSVLLISFAYAANRQRRSQTTTVKGGALSDLLDESDMGAFDKQSFLDYTAMWGKSYRDYDEFLARQSNWLETDQLIKRIDGRARFKAAHNKFSDLSEDEKHKSFGLNKQIITNVTGRRSSNGSETEKRVRPSPTNSTNNTRSRFGDFSFFDSSNTDQQNTDMFDFQSPTFEQQTQPTFDFPTAPDYENPTQPTFEIPSLPKFDFGSMNGNTNSKPSSSGKSKFEDLFSQSTAQHTVRFEYNPFPKFEKQKNNQFQNLQAQECPTGTYYNWRRRKCLKCRRGCADCVKRNICIRCEDEDNMEITWKGACSCRYGKDASGQCRSGCKQGQYYDKWRKRCRNCRRNCSSCVDRWTCEECTNGYDLWYGRCKCLSRQYTADRQCIREEEEVICPAGQYKKDSECHDCQSNCQKCADLTGQCLECDAGYVYNDGQCVPEVVCPAGQYKTNNNTCEACKDRCLNCEDGSGVCYECEAQYKLAFGECVCPENTYTNEFGDCVEVPVCPPEKYLNNDWECIDCKANCAKCTDGTGECIECLAGYVFLDGQCVEDLVCPVGEFKTREFTCAPCQERCHQCKDETGVCYECESQYVLASNECVCPQGTYTDEFGNCIELPVCLPSQYLKDRECYDCPDQCAKCTDQVGQCQECLNSFILSDGVCKCPETHFVDPNGVCTEIPVCEPNQYLTADNVCRDCGANCAKCSNGDGFCTECKESFTLETDTTCACPEGQELTSAGVCRDPDLNCADNEFQKDAACHACGNLCESCQDQTGLCSQCAANSQTITTASATECSCNRGFVERNGVCVVQTENDCNTTTQFWNGQYCEDYSTMGCPTSTYYQQDGWCYYCESSCQYCRDYTAECGICKHDSYVIEGKECKCPEGQIDEGSYCYEPVRCDTNQYRTKENTCENCALNCNTCQDETGECLTCDEGFTISNGECVEPTVECLYEYGPESSPSGCLSTRYSEKRLIPPYAATEVAIDWRDWGIVNQIKDQGNCGSCWAFMSTSQVETWYAIKNGPLLQASEQHLVDCDNSWNMGCQGGWPTESFKFWASQGVISGSDYAYVGYEQTCIADRYQRMFYLDNPAYVDVTANDLSAFKSALRLGPASVAFGASDTFMMYSSGIYDGDCTDQVNHGMTAVGFGVESGVEYVIVRNSWGTWWGEDGYVRVILDQNSYGGKCQVYAWPSYPIIA